MMRVIGMIAGALSLWAGAAGAADLPVAPPSPMIDPYGAQATVTTPIARSIVLGSRQLDLGATDISLVPSQLGGGRVTDLAGPQAFRYLCYDMPQLHQRVWLAVTDEMGNGRAVDMVTVVRQGAGDAATGACPALPAKYQPLTVDGAIQVGSTRASLIQRLGQPSKQAGSWLVFNGAGQGTRQGSRQTVTVRLEQDKVVFLYAANTSTD